MRERGARTASLFLFYELHNQYVLSGPKPFLKAIFSAMIKNTPAKRSVIKRPNTIFELKLTGVFRTSRNDNTGVKNVPKKKISPTQSKKLIPGSI